jgi:hypothetical protein
MESPSDQQLHAAISELSNIVQGFIGLSVQFRASRRDDER